MHQPILFSVVVPTYNRAHIISKTIESILGQTYPHYELLIVDDGSTDNTEQVVQQYLAEKVTYYKKHNAERAAARNYGTQRAKGNYIMWIDSDDTLFPNHLSVAADVAQKNNMPEFIATGYQYQDTAGHIVHRSNYSADVRQDLYKGNQFAMSAPIIRTDIARQNLFNEDRELSASEDYELWLRLAAQYPICTSATVTSAYIWHSERSTVTMKDPNQLIKRYSKFIYYTTNNPAVVKLLAGHKGEFVMKNYLYLSVDLAINGHLALGRQYWAKAFAASPKIIFERGTLAFAKYYLKNLLSR